MVTMSVLGFGKSCLKIRLLFYVLIFQGLYELMLRSDDCSLFFGCCCGDRVGKTSLMNQYLQLFIWDEIRGLLNSLSDFIRMVFVLFIFSLHRMSTISLTCH